MKKVLIIFLIAFIFTAGPFAIKAHAQEVTKPKGTLGLVTKIITDTTETVLAPLTSNNNQTQTETEKTDSSSILSPALQAVNEVVNPVPTETKTARTVSGVTTNAPVTSTDTSEGTQKINTQPKNEEISLQHKEKAASENQQSNPVVSVSLLGKNDNGNSSLVSAGLALPLARNVNLDLLSKGQLASDTSSTELLGLGINGSGLLGSINVDLLSSGNRSSSRSIASIDLNNLLGKTHVGVLETTLGSYGNTGGSLLITDLKGTILGNVHLGVIEVAETESSEYKGLTLGLINLSIDNPLIDEDPIGVVEGQDKEQAGGPTISGDSDIAGIQNKGSPGTFSREENEKSEAFTESELDLDNTKGKMVLSHLTENHSKPFSKIKGPNASDPSKPEVPLALFSVSSNSGGSGSTGGFGGSTSAGSGSGADALVDSIFQKEIELKNQIKFILQELSDEWIKAPPVNPPQASFFLSI